MSHARLVALLVTATVASTAGAEEAKKIQDNSFLIEEAYNQEAGVVQHALAFIYERRSREWEASFTQEWPFRSQSHQLSYTIPLLRGGEPLATGIGDVALNYRYQAVLTDDVAVAPRFSVIAPTGSYRKGRGSGGTGLELQLPVSIEVGEHFVTHWNAGVTHTPRRRASDGTRAKATDYSAGASVIWLASSTFNLMLEAITMSDAVVDEGGGTHRERTTLLSPGFRYAIDHASGAQTVIGLAVPTRVGSGEHTRSLFLYFSFEHPVR
jgi:hypothetical protein